MKIEYECKTTSVGNWSIYSNAVRHVSTESAFIYSMIFIFQIITLYKLMNIRHSLDCLSSQYKRSPDPTMLVVVYDAVILYINPALFVVSV